MSNEEESMYYSEDDEDIYFEDLDDNDEGNLDETTYQVLLETDVQKLQNDDVQDVSSTLSISKGEARKLLYHYRWNNSLLLEEWFSDEVKVRSKVGLIKSSTDKLHCTQQLTICHICFESFPLDDNSFYPTVCGHPFCVPCWKYYIRVSINDGPGCLSLRCPEPNCRAFVVDEDMVNKLASNNLKRKFSRYLVRSYVEENKKMKWCPAPGCENAIEFELGNSDSHDVTCLCSNSFCWNCTEEIHRPVDCRTVGNWILKNSSESENAAWIIAKTKPCPRCRRSIEKNDGCMHMTCYSPCRYEFCWLCLGDWKTHRDRNYYDCNKFKEEKGRGDYNKQDQERKMAEKHLEKYVHYYERWAGNHKSKQKAMDDLQNLKTTDQLDKLSFKFKVTLNELEFIRNAWVQIIECRRVLKWTYAYGYYLSQEEKAKKSLFEYSQGEAEAGLERLHHCAEQELSLFVKIATVDDDQNQAGSSEEETPEKKQASLEAEFSAFRVKLIDLTVLTRSYFENLVRSLENDFLQVERS